MKNLTVYDLPEHMKVYQVVMSDKSKYTVTAKEKTKILQSKGQFIELRTGEAINKAFIMAFKLNKEMTQQNYYELDHEERKILTAKISGKEIYLLES